MYSFTKVQTIPSCSNRRSHRAQSSHPDVFTPPSPQPTWRPRSGMSLLHGTTSRIPGDSAPSSPSRYRAHERRSGARDNALGQPRRPSVRPARGVQSITVQLVSLRWQRPRRRRSGRPLTAARARPARPALFVQRAAPRDDTRHPWPRTGRARPCARPAQAASRGGDRQAGNARHRLRRVLAVMHTTTRK